MKGLRILVVDDEPGVRDCAARVFRYQGCEVHAAKNAEEAFAALHNAPRFDVVLVDLVMPGMGGLRVIREMRAVDLRLRFVVVSGKLISPAERAELASLDVCFCAKPFRNAQLLQSVVHTARRAEQPGGAHEPA